METVHQFEVLQLRVSLGWESSGCILCSALDCLDVRRLDHGNGEFSLAKWRVLNCKEM